MCGSLSWQNHRFSISMFPFLEGPLWHTLNLTLFYVNLSQILGIHIQICYHPHNSIRCLPSESTYEIFQYDIPPNLYIYIYIFLIYVCMYIYICTYVYIYISYFLHVGRHCMDFILYPPVSPHMYNMLVSINFISIYPLAGPCFITISHHNIR
jgi:hypothetical protein